MHMCLQAPYIHLIPYSYIKMHLQSTHTPYTNMHTYSTHSRISINAQHVLMQKAEINANTLTQIYTLPQINRDMYSMYLHCESLYTDGRIHTCLYKHGYAHILHYIFPYINKTHRYLHIYNRTAHHSCPHLHVETCAHTCACTHTRVHERTHTVTCTHTGSAMLHIASTHCLFRLHCC